nr:hypothetical protein [Desertifilum tharense]
MNSRRSPGIVVPHFFDRELNLMSYDNVSVKPETRNHKGFFVQENDYKLMQIDASGWALICLDDAVCHYVDPDDLLASNDPSNGME